MPPPKCARVISLVQRKLTSADSNRETTRTLTTPNHDWMLPPGDLQRSPYIPPVEQRVEQRMATDTEPLPPVIQCITDAPPIMVTPNPTTKRTLRLTKRMHMQRTQNNVPGSVPPITNIAPRQDILIPPTPLHTQLPQRSTCNQAPMATTMPPQLPHVRCVPILGGVCRTPLISQEAINLLTKCVWAKSPDILPETNCDLKFCQRILFTNNS